LIIKKHALTAANEWQDLVSTIQYALPAEGLVSAYLGLANECSGIVAGGSFAIAGFTASRLAAAGHSEEEGLWFFAGVGMMCGPQMMSMSGLIISLILTSTASDKASHLCSTAADFPIIPTALWLFAIPVVGVCALGFNCKYTQMMQVPQAAQSQDGFLDNTIDLQNVAAS